MWIYNAVSNYGIDEGRGPGLGGVGLEAFAKRVYTVLYIAGGEFQGVRKRGHGLLLDRLHMSGGSWYGGGKEGLRLRRYLISKCWGVRSVRVHDDVAYRIVPGA